MSRIQLRRESTGFVPDSQHDFDELASVNIGDVIAGNFRQPRNPAHHRKAFALLNKMYQWQDHDQNPNRFGNFDRFYDWVKLKAGLVELIEINEEGYHWKLASLSFASMGQEEFSKAYQAIVTVAYSEMGMDHVLAEYA